MRLHGARGNNRKICEVYERKTSTKYTKFNTRLK